MKTTVHNKLVRDNIPEIIRAEGHEPHTRVLDREEYSQALLEKLREEVAEFSESHSIEEMADILEVLSALIRLEGFSAEELKTIRQEKREKNGAFRRRLFLTTVDRRE